ncbi:MAG: glycosyltransferase [Acidobacteriota bacterium]|nr:glycosyltransferase [Acidobacteriota bacterium]
MARIVLNTFGSLGDIHPFLAIAIELCRRGHQATVATSEVYRAKIEAEGVGFAPVRPDLGGMLDNKDLIEKVWDARRGTEYLLKDVILPRIEESFEDLDAASHGADLLITHSAGFAGPIVAELRKLPWLSAVLQPMAFLSAYDPPLIAPAPWLKHTYRFGKWPFRFARRFARMAVTPWIEPIRRLRARLGLRTPKHPLFEGQFSPYGTLALFSSHFANTQPDWPPNSYVTGFVFYDQLGAGLGDYARHSQTAVAQTLAEFLANGAAPIVFTLGSSAVMHPGDFFHESLLAVRQLGARAVLLVGRDSLDRFASDNHSIFAADYAPYSLLMPHASAIVHQGGIGTTAQALRAGRPMLVIPWAHDQPDNAERLRSLGVARVIGRSKYKAGLAARELANLLRNPAYLGKATDLSKKIAPEQGIRAASDRIEAALI